MPWRDIGLNAAGLVLYPGVAAAALIGLVLEVAGWISAPWASAGERTPWRIMPRARSFAVRSGPLLPSLLAGLLAVVASVQLAAPFSPIPAADRNLLTAGVSLAGGAWILHAGDRRRDLAQPGLVLSAQLAWLVALLVPAIIPQTLKPQTLGYVTLGPDLPVKVACGLLYLLCLPALLRLAPESPGPAVPDGSGRPAGAGPGDLTVP
ncbi:MAG: hypothetical protein M3010_10560, partial [Candidatus Dormibacteraeota bacterium]|nr:hypothetical protein [Candidatus Dormibacteraeota bacterium]